MLDKYGIRDVEVKKDEAGNITSLTVTFGAHFFVDIISDGGKVNFTLGATHHGMTFDASLPGGELEQAMSVMSTVCKPENQT